MFHHFFRNVYSIPETTIRSPITLNFSNISIKKRGYCHFNYTQFIILSDKYMPGISNTRTSHHNQDNLPEFRRFLQPSNYYFAASVSLSRAGESQRDHSHRANTVAGPGAIGLAGHPAVHRAHDLFPFHRQFNLDRLFFTGVLFRERFRRVIASTRFLHARTRVELVRVELAR